MDRGMRPPNVLKLDGLALDIETRELTVEHRTHRLRPKECLLLRTFMSHPGETLTREFLMQEVWETDYFEDTRTIEVHVSWLRQKIETDTSEPQHILTVRGIGYMFMVNN